jgi:hypothetical protein
LGSQWLHPLNLTEELLGIALAISILPKGAKDSIAVL